jgi:thiamine pyrophosphokinase
MPKTFLIDFLEQNEFKGILCLNGNISKINLLILKKIKNLPIIATDGAYKKLKKIGLLPDVLVGDLDSCGDITTDRHCIKVVFDSCQETSDFQKAIIYARDHEIYPLIIMGLNGGQLDHVIGNINILSDLRDCIFVDHPSCLGILLSEGEKKIFELPINTRISIFPITNAKVNTEGLKWNLDNLDLIFSKTFSLSNFNIHEKIKFQVIDGKILVIFTLSN